MNRKFFGLRLGRADFQDIESLLRINCRNVVVRIDEGIAGSLFESSISSNIKSFEEVSIDCKNPSMKIELGYHYAILTLTDYTALGRGVYEELCDKFHRRQSIISRVAFDLSSVWFTSDAFIPVIIGYAILITVSNMNFFYLFGIVLYFYTQPVLIYLTSRLLLRNRMSLVSNYPKRKPVSGTVSAVVGSIISGILLYTLSQFVELSKIKHLFGL